jgi:hypothetical protein
MGALARANSSKDDEARDVALAAMHLIAALQHQARNASVRMNLMHEPERQWLSTTPVTSKNSFWITSGSSREATAGSRRRRHQRLEQINQHLDLGYQHAS